MFKLRELQKEDIPIINNWRNDPELIDCLGAPFRYINSDVDYAWFNNYMNNRATAVRCAIIDSDTNALIGLVSLLSIDHLNQSAEFHIMIGEKQHRGRGAGTFATKEIIHHAFKNLNLHRIELTVLETNKQAQHMYEKLGFVREGTKRKAKYKNGSFVNSHIYSLLKEEYLTA